MRAHTRKEKEELSAAALVCIRIWGAVGIMLTVNVKLGIINVNS